MKPLFKVVIPGRPIVKKNTQRTIRRHGSVRVIYSAKFREWELETLPVLKRAVGFADPIHTPVELRLKFYFLNRHAEADLSNLVEGPQDALTKAGVYDDDRLVQILHATKHFGESPRTEIEIYPVGEVNKL